MSLPAALTAFFGHGVVIQLALFTQKVGEFAQRICQFALFLRDILIVLALLSRHAGQAIAAATALLELQVLEHVGDIGEKLARLIGRPGLGQVRQRIEHVRKIRSAQTRTTPTLRAVSIVSRSLQPVCQCLSHAGRKIVLGGLFEGFETALDFSFRRPVPQGLFERAAGRLQGAQGIGSAAILGAQGKRPEERLGCVGLVG